MILFKHDILTKEFSTIRKEIISITKRPDTSVICIDIQLKEAPCTDTYIYKNEADRDADFKVLEEILLKQTN